MLKRFIKGTCGNVKCNTKLNSSTTYRKKSSKAYNIKLPFKSSIKAFVSKGLFERGVYLI